MYHLLLRKTNVYNRIARPSRGNPSGRGFVRSDSGIGPVVSVACDGPSASHSQCAGNCGSYLANAKRCNARVVGQDWSRMPRPEMLSRFPAVHEPRCMGMHTRASSSRTGFGRVITAMSIRKTRCLSWTRPSQPVPFRKSSRSDHCGSAQSPPRRTASEALRNVSRSVTLMLPCACPL